MANLELRQSVAWSRRHDAPKRPDKPLGEGGYQHLLTRLATPAAGSRNMCPKYWVQVLQQLFQCWEVKRTPWRPQPGARPQRAVRQFPYPPVATAVAKEPVLASTAEARIAPRSPQRKDIAQAGRPQPNTTGLSGQLPPTPKCHCPAGEQHTAQEGQGKAMKEEWPGRGYTPRTEEAAWAASALTFLLVVLMLAVLYTRLHRNCRRGRSLYWTARGEGQDTVATVLKHRLQSRRKRRSRQEPQQRTLLHPASSDSSE